MNTKEVLAERSQANLKRLPKSWLQNRAKRGETRASGNKQHIHLVKGSWLVQGIFTDLSSAFLLKFIFKLLGTSADIRVNERIPFSS